MRHISKVFVYSVLHCSWQNRDKARTERELLREKEREERRKALMEEEKRKEKEKEDKKKQEEEQRYKR